MSTMHICTLIHRELRIMLGIHSIYIELAAPLSLSSHICCSIFDYDFILIC